MQSRKSANKRAAAAPGTPIRAAQYVRMSTEHQKYSTANQSEANHLYAATCGMEIVCTYADEGISGLTFDKRDALKRLIEDVQSKKADFSAILVYDITRWGRFQDPDESAYYEYLCKRAGIAVHYCAEQFENDGTPFAAIVKAIKRAMAGEYSRELSVKVFGGHARLVKLGYFQGGPPSYGLRRLLIDQTGKVKLELRRRDRKNIFTDRVILAPGDPKEIKTIRRIFKLFVHDGKSEREIAAILNEDRIPGCRGGNWDRQAVHRILRNERYIGNYVWNHKTLRLQSRTVWNAADEWIRAEGVIAPLVSPADFRAAQEIMRNRMRYQTDEEKLEPLRRILREHGRITSRLVKEAPAAPAISCYQNWYGGLIEAYKLIGYADYRPYTPSRRPRRSNCAATAKLSNDDMLKLLHEPLRKHGYLSTRIINETEGIPSAHTYYQRFGSLRQVYHLLADLPDHPGNRPRQSVKRKLNAFAYNLTDDQLLKLLRELLERTGCLTQTIIDADKTLPSATTYRKRFGDLARAYQRIGYTHVRGSGLFYESSLSSTVSITRTKKSRHTASERLKGPSAHNGTRKRQNG